MEIVIGEARGPYGPLNFVLTLHILNSIWNIIHSEHVSQTILWSARKTKEKCQETPYYA